MNSSPSAAGFSRKPEGCGVTSHDSLKHRLSLNFIADREDTARDVVQDVDGRNRKIELMTKLSRANKRVLDQTGCPSVSTSE